MIVTGKNIALGHVYGIIDNDVSQAIVIERKLRVDAMMNKCRIITPYLLEYKEIESKIENLLNRLHQFRSANELAYEYYFTEMYEDLPEVIKLSLLVGFLESYHAQFFGKKSELAKLHQQRLDDILSRLPIAKLNADDRQNIESALKDYFGHISLKERLHMFHYLRLSASGM